MSCHVSNVAKEEHTETSVQRNRKPLFVEIRSYSMHKLIYRKIKDQNMLFRYTSWKYWMQKISFIFIILTLIFFLYQAVMVTTIRSSISDSNFYVALAGQLNQDVAKWNDEVLASITTRQGKALLKFARLEIAKKLEVQDYLPKDKQDLKELQKLGKVIQDENLQSKRRIFVTLYKDGLVRGRMGNVRSVMDITGSVKKNAAMAALSDSTTPPLKPQELDEIQIKVSVLGKPEPISYNDSEQLLKRLKEKQPGVVVKKGSSKATYPPDIWEKISSPAKLLGKLCKNAGLPRHAWKDKETEILTFQMKHFEETP